MNNYIDPTRKLLFHADRIGQIQNGEKPAPVNVEIDLSNRCSLGCADCHFRHTHTRGPWARERKVDTGDLMDTALALRIVGELKDYGVRSITWTGGGEPTLHPEFDKVIDACPIDQGIYTHGGHIDTDRAALLKRRMNWVYVSFDRADRVSYYRYKQADRFEAACAGVTNLVNADGKATIGLGFLLDADSWKDGPEMIRLGEMLGVDYVQFRPGILFDYRYPQRGPRNAEWVKPCADWLESVQNGKSILADVERFWMYANWKEHGYPLCHWAQMQTVITPDGRVWTCVNRRGFEGDCTGDLNNESFADIWARSGAYAVNEQCRVMCRGHIPNMTLTDVIDGTNGHRSFI